MQILCIFYINKHNHHLLPCSFANKRMMKKKKHTFFPFLFVYSFEFWANEKYNQKRLCCRTFDTICSLVSGRYLVRCVFLMLRLLLDAERNIFLIVNNARKPPAKVIPHRPRWKRRIHCKRCLLRKLFVFNLVVIFQYTGLLPTESTCQLITFNWFAFVYFDNSKQFS